jgi:hypothetical protein
VPTPQVCKNPEKVKLRKMELSNEDAVMSKLPRLRNHPDSESRGDGHEARVAHKPSTAAHRPGLGRLSVLRAEGHGLKRVASDPVLRERYNSTPLVGERDSPFWPRKRKSSTTDPFGRKKYDGPILMNGPIEGGDPVPMAYPVIHRRSEATDEDTAHLTHQNSTVSMPPAKKHKGVMRNESPAMVVPSGRRVSSRATFKTPFRTGFDPLAPPPREQPQVITESTDDNENDSGETCTASDAEMSDSDSEGQLGMCQDGVLLKKAVADIEFHVTSQLPPEVEELLTNLPEVDASYSKKIPLDERSGGLRDLVQALRRTFLDCENRESLWAIFGINGHCRVLSDLQR